MYCCSAHYAAGLPLVFLLTDRGWQGASFCVVDVICMLCTNALLQRALKLLAGAAGPPLVFLLTDGE
jgi:hypothetical protein